MLVIQRFGSAVPYWDQWDAEGDLLYKAYINSNLSFATLISSHNEHRVLVTRSFSLGLFELNGGWDPILQMIANAALHVGAIVLLVLIIQRIIRPAQCVVLVFFFRHCCSCCQLDGKICWPAFKANFIFF